eukprot:scaffold327155_cov80-Tisochrysis_lutea.AAC.1
MYRRRGRPSRAPTTSVPVLPLCNLDIAPRLDLHVTAAMWGGCRRLRGPFIHPQRLEGGREGMRQCPSMPSEIQHRRGPSKSAASSG